MDMYKGIIYCATCPNDKKYYGLSTTNIESRKKGHYHMALIKKLPIYFYNAIRKYGFENFKWTIIEEFLDVSKEGLLNLLKEREIFFIKKDQTYLRQYGYNSTLGGDCGPNEETCKKISNINKEKWKDPEYRAKQNKIINDPIFRAKFRSIMQKLAKNNSEKIKEKWKDPEYRAKMINIRNTDGYKENQRNKALDQWKEP